jgi:hypothetical protein
MGRLTLNVLLSFAQFEREVAGERIRDKISASKRRGMWMGGVPPIGYKVENRQLEVDSNNMKLARHIFDRYIVLGSVYKLAEELKAQGIKSPTRISEKGWKYGNAEFSRGSLQNILTNPIYIGRIKHKNNSYEGQHDAIIPRDLWDDVQKKLQEQAASPRGCAKTRDKNLLQGLLFDAQGHSYGPTFTTKNGKRYRYYIDHSAKPSGKSARIPAFEIETLVEKSVRRHLNIRGATSQQEVFSKIERVELHQDGLLVTVLPDKAVILIPYVRERIRKGAIVLRPEGAQKDMFDLPPQELKKLIQGFAWRDEHFIGLTIRQIYLF